MVTCVLLEIETSSGEISAIQEQVISYEVLLATYDAKEICATMVMAIGDVDVVVIDNMDVLATDDVEVMVIGDAKVLGIGDAEVKEIDGTEMTEIDDALEQETYDEEGMETYDASEMKVFVSNRVIFALQKSEESEVNDADEEKQNILAEIVASYPEKLNALEG